MNSFLTVMNYKETRTLGVLSTKGNPGAMQKVKDLLNSLVVVDMRPIKVREIGLQAGSAKTEVRVLLKASVQVRLCSACSSSPQRSTAVDHQTCSSRCLYELCLNRKMSIPAGMSSIVGHGLAGLGRTIVVHKLPPMRCAKLRCTALRRRFWSSSRD